MMSESNERTSYPPTSDAGRRSRWSAQRIAWLTLIMLSFLAGVGVASLWSSSGTRSTNARSSGLTTPTAPVSTRALPMTPTPSTQTEATTLSTLYLDIPPDALATVAAKREEALETWILQADAADFVDATVRLDQDPPVPVQLRLKGDWGDHFTGHKWSYRVETRGGAAVLGMEVFSVQDPSTRAYLNEWLFTEALQAEDILSVRYDFVHGVQNGEALGIYAVEEGFAPTLLESQGRRAGVILRYDEDLLWAYWAANENDLSTPRGVNRFHIIDEFGSGDVAADPLLSAQRDIAVGKLRAWWRDELPFAEVFDVDITARFWALVDVWGAQHALQWHNLRYYYNPVTTLLEPIGFDAQPLAAGSLVDAETLPGRAAALACGDADAQRLYTQYLWTFTSSDYPARLQAEYGKAYDQLRDALWPEFGDQLNPDGTSVLAPPWDALVTRQQALRELLSPFQMTYVYRPTQSPETTLWLDVGNLTGFPVEVLGIETPDGFLPASADWVPADAHSKIVGREQAGEDLVLRPLPLDATHMPYVRLEVATEPTADIDAPGPVITASTSYSTTNAPDTDSNAGAGYPSLLPTVPLKLVTRLWGLAQRVTQTVRSAYPLPTEGPLPIAPPLDEALARHTSLAVSDPDERMLSIPPGSWTITESLVLPQGYGLTLEPGTTLRFGPEALILARGPLLFRGTEDDPIRLGPLGQTWRGIIVLSSDRPSYWDHVSVSDTSAVNMPGWALTGAITFYESPIALDSVRIVGTTAEDAINVIRSQFVFENSIFADTFSDAFDADFCQGEVVGSVFMDIGADAVDLSGSDVRVRDIRMLRLGDKAISAGEASQLLAERVTVDDADYGVVSKDLSHVQLQDATIAGTRVAALAAYIKKPSYGPATMTADQITLESVPDDRITLVQTGSWIDLEGERVWGTDIDVDALYMD